MILTDEAMPGGHLGEELRVGIGLLVFLRSNRFRGRQRKHQRRQSHDDERLHGTVSTHHLLVILPRHANTTRNLLQGGHRPSAIPNRVKIDTGGELSSAARNP